jgi:Spy/CpxP family protein refolding chaperone
MFRIMKSTIKYSIIAIVCAAVSQVAFAQQSSPATSPPASVSPSEGEHHAYPGWLQMRIDFMTKLLDLTADQQTKIANIFKTRTNEANAIRKDQSLNEDQKKEKKKGIEEVMNGEIKVVLTPDQRQKWEASGEKHHP